MTILKSSFQYKQRTLNTSISLDQERGSNDDENLYLSDILPRTDATVADKLTDSSASFTTDGIKVGMRVYNSTDDVYALVTAVDSDTALSLGIFVSPFRFLINNITASIITGGNTNLSSTACGVLA